MAGGGPAVEGIVPFAMTQGQWQTSLIPLDGDFDGDYDVDLADLAFFTGHWPDTPCNASNNWCGGCDLDRNGRVDLADYSIFAQNFTGSR